MIDLLKNLATEKLKETMLSNSLGANETESAAEEGSSELMNVIMEQVKSGGLETVMSLFSNDGTATQDNSMFQGIVGKLAGVLMSKGMNADAAKTEANNIAPSLIDGLKDKFLSNDQADSGFDISKMGDLLGGNSSSGSILDAAKGLLG